MSALADGYLRGLSDRLREFARLEEQQHQVQAEITSFRASDRLGREHAHDRALR